MIRLRMLDLDARKGPGGVNTATAMSWSAVNAGYICYTTMAEKRAGYVL